MGKGAEFRDEVLQVVKKFLETQYGQIDEWETETMGGPETVLSVKKASQVEGEASEVEVLVTFAIADF